LARQTSDALEEMFAGVRAEIIAEFFSKEQNAGHLFPVARELEFRAHLRARGEMMALSIEAKAIIGVFADFVGAKRTALMSSDFVIAAPPPISSPPPPADLAAPTEKASAVEGTADPGESGDPKESDDVQAASDSPKLI
jgi:hypothetical protein